MRVSTNWLRELSGLTKAVSVEMIADKLTMAGLEVEAIEDKAKGFGNVVVGHILEKQQHPQADKLTLCLVNVGESEPVKIVCGAPNHKQGDWVIVARPGAVLPNGLAIKPTKIRGEESAGMLCSESELGISENHDGIMCSLRDTVWKQVLMRPKLCFVMM